jgi:hypothetical protein
MRAGPPGTPGIIKLPPGFRSEENPGLPTEGGAKGRPRYAQGRPRGQLSNYVVEGGRRHLQGRTR